MVVTISKHLEEQLGEEFCTRLVNSCKVSVPMASQQILAGYRVGGGAEQNVRETLAMASRLQQGDSAVAALGVAFRQFIGLLLRQETEILGSKQTAHTVGRINQLIEVVDKYTARERRRSGSSRESERPSLRRRQSPRDDRSGSRDGVTGLFRKLLILALSRITQEPPASGVAPAAAILEVPSVPGYHKK